MSEALLPRKVKNLQGKKFGSLLVTRYFGLGLDGKAVWICMCDCGLETSFASRSLTSGERRSCGCLSRKKQSIKNTPEYNCWAMMRRRCNNQRDKCFFNYGGRGIAVCDRWNKSFTNFISDMGPKPTKSHTIERVNNDGPYSPENCRWATRAEQMRNNRKTHFLTFEGKTMCLTDWAKEIGVKKCTLHLRLKTGWSIEQALTIPVSSGTRRLR